MERRDEQNGQIIWNGQKPKKIFKNLYYPDFEDVLLRPNRELGELAVLNPGIPQTDSWPKPFLYRTELTNPDPAPGSTESLERIKIAAGMQRPDPFGRHSVIKLKHLESPTSFVKDPETTIIFPTESYEKSIDNYRSYGTEDPRITKVDNTYYITYVAYDGNNALVALATTKDFKEIKKHGVISPQISLEECIKLVDDQDYKILWQAALDGAKNSKIDPSKMFPMDKDAFLHKNNQWELYHRLGNYLQISKADNLDDFKSKDYWIEQIRNLSTSTVMKNKLPWIEEDWASEKIGWGSQILKLKNKEIVLWHGVSEKNGEYIYHGSILEIKNGKVVSILRDPLLKPTAADLFAYYDGNKFKKKHVIFPTAAIVDEPSRKLWMYSGKKDEEIGVRSTSLHYIYDGLNKSCNRVYH